MSSPVLWRCRDRALDLTRRTAVMGIVNVTPDSFSDGGRWFDPAAAVVRCRELAAEGATILDLGAESTRPGAAAVPAEEQLRRLEPVLAALAAAPAEGPEGAALVSVDTRDAAVAGRALDWGAHAINDVSGLGDPAMAGVVAASGAGLVLMHMRGTPETMQSHTAYGDVVAEVAAHLRARAERALEAGVEPGRIVLDPGIGFAKSAEQSLELLARLGELVALGWPVLVGASRKSFLSRLGAGESPADRLEGSLAAAALAAFAGARLLRVHDVAATVRAVRLADAARSVRA